MKIIKLIIIFIVLILIGIFSYSVIITIKRFEIIKTKNIKNKLVIPNKPLNVYNIKLQKNEKINLKNKKIFLHFWATWCKPCIEEFGAFDSILNQSQNIDIYFISNESKKVVSKFSKKYSNIPFYSIQKKDNLFKIEYLPTTIYNIKDTVLTKKIGKYDWTNFFKKLNYE